MELSFFDAYVTIGPRKGKHPAHPWKLDDVLADMQHCSISGALVAHQLSVSYDPMYGNTLLLDEIAPYPNLFPVWNVMPHYAGDFPDPETLLAQMRAHDVRAVTLFARANAWALMSPTSAPLLQMLERERILTLIRADQLNGYLELEELLTRYPNLPVLLNDAHWGQQRYVVPLMQQHKNLHLSFSHYQAHYGLEYLTEMGCEDQLIYGSNAPVMSMGAHRAFIDYSPLPEEIRAKIAGGNLRRLLNGQGPETLYTNQQEDSLMRNARLGQPQEGTLLDMHTHILHEGMNGAGGGYLMHKGGPSGVHALAQRLGYDGAGIMSWQVVSADSQGGNRAVQAALDYFPEGYWGLASFDPAHYTEDEMIEQMRAQYQDPRFLGIKPYVTFGMRYDDPRYARMWEYANELGVYALIHRNAGDFSEVSNLAPKYPNIAFVVAHCGADYATADQGIACAQQHPNVFLEITLTPVTAGIVEYLVAGAGEDRVLYGSDLPMRDPRQQLGWVVYSRLSETVKAKVLGLNAQAILRNSRTALAR